MSEESERTAVLAALSGSGAWASAESNTSGTHPSGSERSGGSPVAPEAVPVATEAPPRRGFREALRAMLPAALAGGQARCA